MNEADPTGALTGPIPYPLGAPATFGLTTDLMGAQAWLRSYDRSHDIAYDMCQWQSFWSGYSQVTNDNNIYYQAETDYHEHGGDSALFSSQLHALLAPDNEGMSGEEAVGFFAFLALDIVSDGTGGEAMDAVLEDLGLEAAGDVAADTGEEVELAAYGGTKTSGILYGDNGEAYELQSGYDGPSQGLPKPRPGMNGNIVSHVEAHAAALMRTEDMDEATLLINRSPCAGSNGCLENVSRMVPEGKVMNIYVMEQGSSGPFLDWLRVIGTGPT